MIPVLWLCGPSGVGKSTVGWEIYSQLIRSGIEAGYVDIDQLGICYPEPASDPGRHRMKARNLSVVVTNFQAAGAGCVVVAGHVDGAHGVYIDQFPQPALVMCRLRADPDELRQRFLGRGTPDEDVEDVLREAEDLDASTFAKVLVDTSGLSVAEVARQVRDRASGWPVLTSSSSSSPAVQPTEHPAKGADGPILWLTGATGVGKSTVGFTIYQKVLRAGLTAGYVDVNQIGFRGPGAADHRLRARNLAAMWQTYRSVGAQCLVVVGPVQNETTISVYAEALPAASVTWVRLHAGRDELTRRIMLRGEGGSWHEPGDALRGQSTRQLCRIADEAVTNADALERAAIGLRIDTDWRTVEEIADSIADQTGWPGRLE